MDPLDPTAPECQVTSRSATKGYASRPPIKDPYGSLQMDFHVHKRDPQSLSAALSSLKSAILSAPPLPLAPPTSSTPWLPPQMVRSAGTAGFLSSLAAHQHTAPLRKFRYVPRGIVGSGRVFEALASARVPLPRALWLLKVHFHAQGRGKSLTQNLWAFVDSFFTSLGGLATPELRLPKQPKSFIPHGVNADANPLGPAPHATERWAYALALTREIVKEGLGDLTYLIEAVLGRSGLVFEAEANMAPKTKQYAARPGSLPEALAAWTADPEHAPYPHKVEHVIPPASCSSAFAAILQLHDILLPHITNSALHTHKLVELLTTHIPPLATPAPSRNCPVSALRTLLRSLLIMTPRLWIHSRSFAIPPSILPTQVFPCLPSSSSHQEVVGGNEGGGPESPSQLVLKDVVSRGGARKGPEALFRAVVLENAGAESETVLIESVVDACQAQGYTHDELVGTLRSLLADGEGGTGIRRVTPGAVHVFSRVLSIYARLMEVGVFNYEAFGRTCTAQEGLERDTDRGVHWLYDVLLSFPLPDGSPLLADRAGRLFGLSTRRAARQKMANAPAALFKTLISNDPASYGPALTTLLCEPTMEATRAISGALARGAALSQSSPSTLPPIPMAILCTLGRSKGIPIPSHLESFVSAASQSSLQVSPPLLAAVLGLAPLSDILPSPTSPTMAAALVPLLFASEGTPPGSDDGIEGVASWVWDLAQVTLGANPVLDGSTLLACVAASVGTPSMASMLGSARFRFAFWSKATPEEMRLEVFGVSGLAVEAFVALVLPWMPMAGADLASRVRSVLEGEGHRDAVPVDDLALVSFCLSAAGPEGKAAFAGSLTTGLVSARVVAVVSKVEALWRSVVDRVRASGETMDESALSLLTQITHVPDHAVPVAVFEELVEESVARGNLVLLRSAVWNAKLSFSKSFSIVETLASSNALLPATPLVLDVLALLVYGRSEAKTTAISKIASHVMASKALSTVVGSSKGALLRTVLPVPTSFSNTRSSTTSSASASVPTSASGLSPWDVIPDNIRSHVSPALYSARWIKRSKRKHPSSQEGEDDGGDEGGVKKAKLLL